MIPSVFLSLQVVNVLVLCARPRENMELNPWLFALNSALCSSEEEADGGEGVLREAQIWGLEGFAHIAAPAAFSRARR